MSNTMKKKLKVLIYIFILFFLMAGCITYLMLRPAYWTNEIISFINQNYFQDHGWNLSIEELNGDLISDVQAENVYLKKSDGSMTIFGETATFDIGITELLAGNFILDHLSVDNVLVTYKQKEVHRKPSLTSLNTLIDLNLKTLLNSKIDINDLDLKNVSILVQNNSDETLYNIDYSGRIINSKNDVVFGVDFFKLTDLEGNIQFNLIESEIEVEEDLIVFNLKDGSFNNLPVSGKLEVILNPELSFHTSIDLEKFPVKTLIPVDFMSLINYEKLDIHFELETDLVQYGLNFGFREIDSDKKIGHCYLNIYYDGQDFRIDDGKFISESLIFNLLGELGEDDSFSLTTSFENLDLSENNIIDWHTQMKGYIETEGVLNDNHLENLVTNIKIQNEYPGSPEYIYTFGKLEYNDLNFQIIDSLIVDLNNGRLFLAGSMDLARARYDLTISSDNLDLSAIEPYLALDINGSLHGSIDVVGSLHDPSVEGVLSIDNVEFKHFKSSSLITSFRYNSLIERPNGYFTVVTKNGNVFSQDFLMGNADFYVNNDTIQIAKAKIEIDDGYVQFSGKYAGNENFTIDMLQLSAGDHFVSNLGQISINLIKGGLIFNPVEFSLDNGSANVSFKLVDSKIEEGNFHLTNVDLEMIKNITQVNFPYKGSAFGSISLNQTSRGLKGRTNIHLKDGEWGNLQFTELNCNLSLHNEILQIHEYSVLGLGESSFELSGFCNLEEKSNSETLKINPDGNISFTSVFRNFSFDLASQYLPFNIPMNGKLTGTFVMSGIAHSPEMIYEYTIENPIISRIKGDYFSASGRYIDQRLFFEDMVFTTKSGKYSGSGYLPIDLSLVTNNSRFSTFSPMSFEFHGVTSEIDFLTPYITSVDSITGEIKFDLTLEGTPENPVRNGNISLEDGTIYAFLLDFPIHDVNGSAVIKDNQFIIDEFTAASIREGKGNILKDISANIKRNTLSVDLEGSVAKLPPNIKITGSMDMTEFFSPKYAYLITGKDVYIRTLLGEIEGVGDLKLSMTGKDTVNIVGDIIPQEAIIRTEFGESDRFSEIEEKGSTVTYYNIHFPIEKSLVIRNSQVDADVIGDMSIFRFGNEDYRYSGELEVIKGKYYYLSDIFNIEDGRIILDPTEDYPIVDVEATIEVEDIEIQVTITGNLGDPTILIETLGSGDYYSQSDLLQLLTIQKRLEDQEMSSDAIRSQSINIFGKIIENELEKSLIRMGPLDEFEIEGSSNLLRNPENSDISLKLGKRVSQNLYLSYKRHFSLVQPDEVGIEYRLNKNLSVVGSYDEEGQLHLKYRLKYQY